jgi:hypothetical protein
VSSQWLSQLSLLSSKDPRSPQGPQAPQIHRSTESTEPGSSPDLLDLSYAAMQILTMLIYCFYRQLLIQHASRNVESVYSQSHLSHTLTLVRFRFDCAAGFALLNLPKGKSLGRSKPATSSYAQALQHTVWDSYYIQALLNCLMRNKISTTNVSELGYLFHDKSSLHIIA